MDYGLKNVKNTGIILSTLGSGHCRYAFQKKNDHFKMCFD